MDEESIRKARHELKTPLTVIKGAVELLFDHGESLPAAGVRILERLDRAVADMEQTIDRVLGSSANGHGPRGADQDQPATNETQAAEKLDKVKDIGGFHVALVEDQEVNREIISALLQKYGLRVTSLSSGEELLDYLQAQKPDLVLLDVEMDGIDGLETTRRTRSEKRFADLPIIALTAHTGDQDRKKCVEAGMNDVLHKPIDPVTLIKTLGSWLTGTNSELSSLNRKGPGGSSGNKVLDTDQGLARVGGDPALYHKLLKKFAANHLQSSDQIWSALDELEEDSAIRIAHTVKGVAGNMGASELYQIASKLEETLKAERHERVPPLMEQLDQALNRLQLRLSETLVEGTDNSSHDEPADISQLRTLITQIRYHLKDDLSVASELAVQLRNALNGNKAAHYAAELCEAIDSFDPDLAVEKLDQIVRLIQPVQDGAQL